MRSEVVQRRRWLTDEQFLDMLGAANLIPGPSSTEMAIFIGCTRAGAAGLVLAGTLFILPAMLIVLAFAWAYVHYGSIPQVGLALYGVKPVIIAVVLQALWGLSRTAAKTWQLAVLGATVFALYLAGANVIALLIGSGLLVLIALNWSRLPFRQAAMLAIPAAGTSYQAGVLPATAAGVSLAGLGLTFLKIGAVLFGSGYVLLAFLQADFVERLHWLTEKQILDAVAVGQFTPGPVFTTATFIGYLLAGIPGAIVSTVAIFLPGFVFVAIVYRLLPRLRRSPWTSAFLDGVNIGAVGLMAGVTVQLGRASIVDWPSAAIGLAAAVALLRFRINSAWLVLAGGLAGVATAALHGT